MPIPKVKDPALVELEKIVTTKLAMPCSFIFADLFEANFGLDKLSPDTQFPVFVYLKNGTNKESYNVANEIQRKFKVYGFMLNSAPMATTKDFSSEDLNSMTNQMRNLAENLMYWINKSPLSVDGGVDDWTSDDVYEMFDAHLYGHAIVFEWTVLTATTGYYNNPG